MKKVLPFRTYLNNMTSAKWLVASTFVFIFLCHCIVFLAFYPGLCSYDMDAQIAQYINHDFCTSHPLVHSLYLGFFHNLFQNPNDGYAIATILQIAIVDGALTYALSYAYHYNHNKLLYVCCILFYAIFPVTPLLTISHTKDIPFASFALIFFIDTLRLSHSQLGYNKYITYIRITINATLMVLFRNNAIYAIMACVFIQVLIWIYRHNKHRSLTILSRILVVYMTILITSLMCSRILFISTNSTKGSIKEMMSIPAQIMGYIYNNSATDSEKDTISQYIPNPEDYNYYLADSMKKDLPFEIWESGCKHFLLDSAILAIHHPQDATNAILLNIQGFFDPIHCPYSSDHFYLARHDYRGDAIQESRLPRLCDIYVNNFYVTEKYTSSPIIVLLNMGLYVWIVILASIVSFTRKVDFNNLIAYFFPLLYLATLLLGPGAIIRYGFLYILIAPITLFFIFHPTSHNAK